MNLKLNFFSNFVSRNVSLIVGIPIIVFLNLWLLESSLKYGLIIFEISLFLIVYNLSFLSLVRIKYKFLDDIPFKIDCFFLIISLTLFMQILYHSNNIITFICAMIVSFLLPGYVLLRLLGFFHLNTWVEWLVLAFILSFGLTSLLFVISQQFILDQTFLISLLYVCMSSIPVIKKIIFRRNEKSRLSIDRNFIEFNLFELLTLLWIILIFVFIVSNLYPQMAYVIGLDIISHLSSTKLLSLAPEVYTSIYPWFHSTITVVYKLSNPSMNVLQTGLAYLGLLIVFAFYIMSKIYLGKIDSRAPVLATLFFSVFSGFGWLHFLGNKLNTSGIYNQIALLEASNSVSYWDVGYGQGLWLWLWYRPMSVAIIIICLMLYFLNRKDISRLLFIPVFSLLLITLCFVHFPDAIMFYIFILFCTFFIHKTIDLRLKDVSISMFIVSVIFLINTSSSLFGFISSPPLYVLLILLFSAITSCILFYLYPYKMLNDLRVRIDKLNRFVKIFTDIIILLFIVCILSWISFPDFFLFEKFDDIYFVPIVLYPILLGLVGLFAISSFPTITKKYGRDPIIIFLFLFFFTFGFGKVISMVNVNFIELGYGERRFLPIIYTAASILASISFVNLIPRFFAYKNKFLIFSILMLIIITGIMSTYLSIESWKFSIENPVSLIDNYSISAVDFLSSPNNRDIKTPILTASLSTRAETIFIPTPYRILNYIYPIWESINPEIPLMLIYNARYLPPYLFLSNKDNTLEVGSNTFMSYFSDHMVSLLSQVYRNPEISVLSMPPGSPPSLESKSVLVIPDDNSTEFFYIYEILSFGKNDYTVSFFSDIKTIKNAETIILTRDDEDHAKLLDDILSDSESDMKNRTVIIFNTKGNGPLSNLFFNVEDEDENIKVNRITGASYNLDLPIEVDAPSLIAKKSVRILSTYSSGVKETPFSLELRNDTKKIVYINIYPLIKAYMPEELPEELPEDSRQMLNLIMNKLKDDKIRDISKNGNNGIVYEAKLINLLNFGEAALDFNGKNSYVEVYNSNSINHIDEITVEAFVKIRNVDKGFSIISKKQSYSSLNGYTFLYASGNFYFNFGNGTDFFDNYFSYDELKNEQWYHLVVTYDKQYVKYYVNGKNVGSIKQSETITPNNLNLLIGKSSDGSWKLDGSIYEILLYNTSLTESEIKERSQKFFIKVDPKYAKNENILDPKYSSLGQILGNITRVAEINLPSNAHSNSWVFEGNTAFFKTATLNGDIVIQTSSFIDLSVGKSTNTTFMIDNKIIPIKNIKKLYITQSDDIKILAKKAEIKKGKSFYIKSTLTNSTLSGKNIHITLITVDGETKEITSQQGVIKIDGVIDAYLRTPSFFVIGEINFKEMYSLFSIYPWLRSLGHDLNIKGEVEFQFTSSDVYSFITNLTWKGSFHRSPEILPWNEISSIPLIFPWLLIILIVPFSYSYLQKEDFD